MVRPSTPVRRPQTLAWLITVPLAVVALAIATPLVVVDDRPWRHVALAPAFLAMFVLSRVTSLRLDIRRQAVRVNLMDLPLLIGLFYLSPLLLIALQALAVAVMEVAGRVRPVKSLFNIVSVTAATAVTCLVMQLTAVRDPVSGGWQPAGRTWFALVIAVGIGSVVGGLPVVGVIALLQGRSHTRPMGRSLGITWMVTGVSIVIGLMMLLALQVSLWAVLLIMLLAALLGLGSRSYAQFLRQHDVLADLYELTNALGVTTNDGTLFDVLLTRARQVARAESATLWLPPSGRHPEVVLSARADYHGLLDSATTPELLRRRAFESGQTVVVGPKVGPEDLRAAIAEHGVGEAIVVPLRSGAVVIGTLEVAARLGDTTFARDDARFVETVAAHAGVAVENSRLLERLRFDATHDPLTALPNRRRMLDALSETLAAPALGEVTAVLIFDVVGLRRVNESLGYSAGDNVLVEVARRLCETAPPGAMVARIGGDEFVVEIRAVNVEAALKAADRIRGRLSGQIPLDGLSVTVDVTVGLAVYPDHGDSPDVLLQRAEVASYAAKARGGIQLFDAGLETRTARRHGLAGELRRALERREIDVHYQPKVAVGDQRVVGLECFTRWEHPRLGAVSPIDAVAVAEHTGQLPHLTELVLREGLGRLRDWSRTGRELTIAVNVAARTLLDPAFPDLVADLLQSYGVPARQLVLEITEEAMASDSERPLPTLHHLHDLGVSLSIDDFGTGFSSLSYLRRLPVQEIKVDRTFIEGMVTDRRDLAVVRGIVELARNLGLTSVAEGVESEAAFQMLREVGCDVAQGYLFARPLPYHRMEAWLQSHVPGAGSGPGETRRLSTAP